MTTTLQRLVDYPHAAVFDKSPAAETVFRLRHADGASWEVAEGVMTARAGAAATTCDLAAMTVAQLSSALTAAGYQVAGLSPSFAALSALVLVEGSGSESTSNGDRVPGYTSLMWALMGGYAVVVREAGIQVVQALRQMIITQAEDEWLDLWGKLYDVARDQGELDAAYAPRIPKEAFRLRESPIAIEQAVFDATGKTIRIEEPWVEIFRLDGSTLSGPDKFANGERVGYFLIQPTATVPLDWSDVLPVIHRNRAAGVLVLPPFSRMLSHVDADIHGSVVYAGAPVHCRHQRYEDRTLLDYSNIEDLPILNHPVIRSQTVRRRSESSVSAWLEHPWPDLEWRDESYLVQGHYYRSYRLYQFSVSYVDQYWPDFIWQQERWADFNVRVASSHTRS